MADKEITLRERLRENFPQYQSDEKALQLAEKALEDYSAQGISGYEDIVERFLKNGRLEYEGFPVKNAHALALLLQTFRNINFETFRLVYMRGDTIAAMTGVESRLPHITFTTQEQNLAKEAYNIRNRMQRLEADGFYMVHNHPTGEVTPSIEDTLTTMRYARNFPGFRGHIILDHTQYALLNEKGELTGKFEIPEDYQNPLFYETDTFAIGTRITSSDELATFADHLNPIPARSVLVFSDTKGNVRTFQEIENKILLHDKNFPGYLRNEMVRSGCPRAFLATQNEDVYENSLPLIRQRYLIDCVYVDDIGMESGFEWLKTQEKDETFFWAGLKNVDIKRHVNNGAKISPILKEEVMPYNFIKDIETEPMAPAETAKGTKKMKQTENDFLEEMRAYFAGEKEEMSAETFVTYSEYGWEGDTTLQISKIKGCYWRSYADGSGSLRRLDGDTEILSYDLGAGFSPYSEYHDATGWCFFERTSDWRGELESLVIKGVVRPSDHGPKKFALCNKDSTEKRLFVDMDGTLAEFCIVDTVEKLYEKGYFAQLTAHENVVDGLKMFIKENPETEVFILSSVLTDSLYARNEKNAWLDRYLPEIGEENRIFVPCGRQKSYFVPGGVKESDILLDDYSKNLHEWPGEAIKLMNGINGNKGSWKGKRIDFQMQAAAFTEKLANLCEGMESSMEKDANVEEKTLPKLRTAFQTMNGQLLSNPQTTLEEKDYGMQEVCKAEISYPVNDKENKVMKLTATYEAAQELSKYSEGDMIAFVGIPTQDGYQICRMDDGTLFEKQQKELYHFTVTGGMTEPEKKTELSLSAIRESFKTLSYEEKFKLVLEEEIDCQENEPLKETLWEAFRDNDKYLGFFGKELMEDLTKRRDRFLEIQADMDKEGGIEI